MSVIVKTGPYQGNLDFSNYPFELSDFQKHAIQGWEDDSNIFISAHTGSGKTLPAEWAINRVVSDDSLKGIVIYTTPIKSLSNDKYKSIQDKFPDADVGIITGDMKYNPTGNVIIMTTEILRNLLYNKKIEDVKNKVTIEIDVYNLVHTIVFDEVHYINDKYRGSVWEECFILLPPSIRLISLSATIDNPKHFCNWLALIKNKDIVHTYTDSRVVPLEHSIFLDYLPSYLNKKEGNSSEKLNNTPIVFSSTKKPFDSDLYIRTLSHAKRTAKGLSRQKVINNLVEYLDIHNLTPAIFFSFSRKYCEKLAGFVTKNLLKDKEGSLVDKIVDNNLRKTDNYLAYKNMTQFLQLKKSLDKGVAFHHSGLLPVFKEIVEILFAHTDEEGKPHPLVKVLFATETFAVGVNMPTKTVVFTGLEKYTEGGKRYIYPHEYLQMSGRAGRRGIDTRGLIILLPNINYLPEVHAMKNLLFGKSQFIKSKFTPNYQIILKSIINGNDLGAMIKKSLVSKEVEDDSFSKKEELKQITVLNLDTPDILEYEQMKSGDYGLLKLSKKLQKANKRKVQDLEYDKTFMRKYNTYKKLKPVLKKRRALESDVKSCETYLSSQIVDVKDILTEEGYLENVDGEDVVTTKGQIAANINECNGLLLTELIVSNRLDTLDYKELGTLLSIFGDCKKHGSSTEESTPLHITEPYKPIVDFVNNVSAKMSEKESYKRLYLNTKWTINTGGMNATYDWLNDGDFNTISKKYGIYEGNLTKDFIRLYNLSATVQSVATMLQKNDLSIQASKIMDVVMRDVVTVESLYVL